MQIVVADLWKSLIRATNDKNHPFRYLTLATIKAHTPSLRTVVLRKVRPDHREILFFTHGNSPKVAQLTTNPSCALLVYHPKQKIQARLTATAHIDFNNEMTKQYWANIPSMNRPEYLGPPPGSVIAESSPPTSSDPHAFCIITCRISHIDWLQLNRSGHQRYLFEWQDHHWKATEVKA